MELCIFNLKTQKQFEKLHFHLIHEFEKLNKNFERFMNGLRVPGS
jgi:hypothetical protein